jgi:hypothetical protein
MKKPIHQNPLKSKTHLQKHLFPKLSPARKRSVCERIEDGERFVPARERKREFRVSKEERDGVMMFEK